MNDEVRIEVRVRFPFWLSAYIWLLGWASVISGREPDPDKFSALVLRHVKVEVI